MFKQMVDVRSEQAGELEICAVLTHAEPAQL